MRKPLTNKFLWILWLLIAFPLMSCADSVDKQGSSESSLVELIKQFSDQFAERSLTVKKMEGYLYNETPVAYQASLEIPA